MVGKDFTSEFKDSISRITKLHSKLEMSVGKILLIQEDTSKSCSAFVNIDPPNYLPCPVLKGTVSIWPPEAVT